MGPVLVPGCGAVGTWVGAGGISSGGIQPVGSVHRSQDTEEAKLIGPGKETRQVLVQTIVKVKYLVSE